MPLFLPFGISPFSLSGDFSSFYISISFFFFPACYKPQPAELANPPCCAICSMQGQPNACTASARNWGTKVLRSRLPEHLHILGSPGTVPLLSVSSAFPKQMLKKLFSKEYTFQNKQSKYLACTLILIGIKTLLLKWMIFKYLLPIPTSIPNEGSLRIFLFGRVLDVCLQQQQENRTVTSWLCLPSAPYLIPYLMGYSLKQRTMRILGGRQKITARFLQRNRCKVMARLLIHT